MQPFGCALTCNRKVAHRKVAHRCVPAVRGARERLRRNVAVYVCDPANHSILWVDTPTGTHAGVPLNVTMMNADQVIRLSAKP